MKHSLLFSLVIISLSLTSCSLIRWVETEAIKTPSETPEIIVPEKETPVATPDDDKKPDIKPSTDKTPTTPVNNTPKSEEVSTEELTKELDAFVDDITKGL